MNWFMNFLAKIESIFDKGAPFMENAAKVVSVVGPAFGPEGAAIGALAGVAGQLTGVVEKASLAHQAEKAAPEYNQLQSAITSASTIIQGVVEAAPALGLPASTVAALTKVASVLPQRSGPQG